MQSLIIKAKKKESELLRSIHESEYKIKCLCEELEVQKNKKVELNSTREKLEIVSKLLQEVLVQVTEENIIKIEGLVNIVLGEVFNDKDLKFKIQTEVQRSINLYKFTIIENGDVEGCEDSFGGGVLAVISVSLKIIFNILTKRFPLLLLDESLSFLSDNYIENFSKVMKELSLKFGLTILLITHQPQFAEEANIKLNLSQLEAGQIHIESFSG